MQYALLIYGDFDRFHALTDEEKAADYALNDAMHARLEENGRRWTGTELDAPATATTVRRDGGGGDDVVLTDGPFAETTEQFGGFYLIEADDLDEALGYARMLGSTVEVRPIR
jgi:hypothetical protein